MRIISFNANGIRSAATKNFFEWFQTQNADVLCVQETKAQEHQLSDSVFQPKGYHAFYRDASTKKGYSGVAIYAKKKPDEIRTGLGWDEFDEEGRFIEARFGDLSVVSLYLPSGSSKEERQQFKFKVMDWIRPKFAEMLASGRKYVVCGDWNIVHREIDIKNFKSNQQTSGCLPEERAWLDKIVNGMGWVDAFRVVNQEPGQYTWWSHRGRAWDNNVGWRIDYQVVTPDLQQKITSASIYTDQRFSDHAPVIVDYDI